QSGKELRDAEIIVRSPRRRAGCLISANPILSHQGQIIGVVATLKRIETVHWLVNRMTGAEARFTFSDIMGQSGKMKQAVKIGRIAAECSSVVLLQGESGTGKELFAQAIHRAGLGDRPFVALNCGAIPRSLLESELFGYEGGSFTGADKRGRPGKFELADGGTVFLDEIGEMPLDMQVVLLRVLEEKKVYRIGGQRAIPLNVRVITATNKNLASEIEKGRFREDLYYRLNVLTIDIPPLRERKEDIPLLCDHFLKQIGSRLNKKVEGIDPLALQRLISYHWPGNVRELENVLERGIILGSGSLLRICDLPDYLQNLEASSWQPEIAFERTSGEKNKSLGEVEKTLIAEALRSTEGNITQAARILGIGRSTLYRKMSRYTLSSR
ncbi:two-component system, NtrC family, nitrogen regulation response regulator GlnG, partial [Candidatus Hakubella thermalkaliphila]